MKRSISFPLFAIILMILSFSAAGQVRQVFLFKDAVTDKPLDNVRLTIVGENEVISNSEGIAVLVSSTKKRGEEYFVKSATKDGYVYLGRSWKSSANYPLLSKDTAEYLLCSAAEYRKISNLYYAAAMKYMYRKITTYFDGLQLVLNVQPSDYDEIARKFISANMFNNSVDLTYTMPSVRKIMILPQKIRKDCEDLIAKGENRKAIDLIGSRIRENDLTQDNLMTVDYYLNILDLEPEYKNSINLTSFYRILAKERETEVINYLWALGNSKEIDLRLEYPRWKSKLKTKESQIYGEYYYNIAWAGDDNGLLREKMKSFLDKMALWNEQNQGAYDIALAQLYSRFAAGALTDKDTAQALGYRDKMFRCFDRVSADNDIERIRYNNEFIRLTLNSGGTLAEDSVREKEISDWLKGLLQTDFESDSSLLIVRIPYLIYSSLQTNMIEDTREDCLTGLRKMEYAIKQIEKDCEKYYLRDLWRLKYNEIMNAVDYYEMMGDWQEMVGYYHRIDAIYPDMLLMGQYYINNEIFKYVKDYDTDDKVDAVVRNSDTILQRMEKYDRLYSYFERTKVYHGAAEFFYFMQDYYQSISYYNKEIECRTLMAQEDSTLWIDLSATYLQTGDAYSHVSNYAKAIEMYSKVNDLEGKITANDREKYNLKKISAVYFTGEVYRMQKDYQKALKYYADAEQDFLQLTQENGDVSQSLAEMYYSRHTVWDSLGDKQKSFENLQSAYNYYRKAGNTSISQRYISAQKKLLNAYANRKDWKNYNMVQYNLLDTYNDYSKINKDYFYPYSELSFTIAERLENERAYSDAIKFYKQTLNAWDTIKTFVNEVDYQTYWKSNYRTANLYYNISEWDSAVVYYDKCLKLSSDYVITERKQINNEIDLANLRVADIYETKSELYITNDGNFTRNDTLELRYLEYAAKYLSRLNLSDNTEVQYKLAAIKQRIGYKYICFSRFTDALNVLQQSNNFAMQCNKGKTKNSAQCILAYNYLLIGGIYDNSDRQQAKKEYYKMLKIYDKASSATKKKIKKYRGMAAEKILDILVYDEVRKDNKEIRKMKKIMLSSQ